VAYAHVDSVNVFRLIEEILGKPRSNPVHAFERFPDISSWLREQWAGLFRELLRRTSSQQQIATLSTQVETLGAINSTLQRYLETVVEKVSPEEAPQLIEAEQKKLVDLELIEQLRRNAFYSRLLRTADVTPQDFREALIVATTFEEFVTHMGTISEKAQQRVRSYEDVRGAREDLDCGRRALGLAPFGLPD